MKPLVRQILADEIANFLLVIDDQYVSGFAHTSADAQSVDTDIIEDIYGYNSLQKDARSSSTGCERSLHSSSFDRPRAGRNKAGFPHDRPVSENRSRNSTSAALRPRVDPRCGGCRRS